MGRPAAELAAIAVLLVYVVLFYRVPLSALAERLGRPYHRGNLLIDCLSQVGGLPLLESPSWLAAVDRLPVLGLAAAVLACAAAAGWLTIDVLGVTRGMTRLEQGLFGLGVGTNLVSTYVLAVGLAGGLHHRWLFVAPAIAVVAAAAWRGWSIRDRSSGPPASAARAGHSGSAALLGGGLVFAALLVAGAVLPPWEFDVREYHLQAPKEFLEQGRIGFLPHNVYANMALGTEMLTLGAMAAAGDWWCGALAGKTVLGVLAALTGLAVYAAGRRWFSPAAGIVGAVLYVSLPWVFAVSTNGLIDMAAAWYWFLTFLALLWWDAPPEPGAWDPTPRRPLSPPRTPSKPGRLALLGYLAGSCVACKYPGALFVVIPVVAWVAWRAWGGWRKLCAALGVCLLFVALACGLWLAKNAVLTGNPTYPLLSGVFPAETRTEARQAQWERVHRPRNFSPAALVADVRRVVLESPWLGPLVVPLAAVGIVGRRHRGIWLGVGWLVWVMAGWWLLTHRIDRFWIPVLPLLALLSGVGWTCLQEPWSRSAARTLLILSLGASLLVVTSGVLADTRYLAPLDTLRQDPQRLGVWRQWLNGHAAGPVLVIGDAQVFDYTMPVLYSTCFDPSPWEDLALNRTPAEIHRRLAERRIGTVYVDWGEIARYRQPGNYGFTEFVQPEMFERLVASGVLEELPPLAGHAGRAYRVRPEPPRGAEP